MNKERVGEGEEGSRDTVTLFYRKCVILLFI
jgi:hypothetical protein